MIGGVMSGRKLPVLLILLLLLASFLGWIYWNRFERIFELRGKIAELKEKRGDLIEEISSLESKRNRRNDIDYIEKLAQEELGLVYPSDEKAEGEEE